jgi:hypothetical protein
VFRCLWEVDHPAFGVEKRRDGGNRNIYVVDGAGRRLDHVATTEAAKLGGTFTKATRTMHGDFVFPAGASVDPPFTLHDDDHKAVITDIRLDPARMTGRGGAAERDVRTRVGRIRQADEIDFVDARSSWGVPRSKGYVLYRAAYPASTMDAFFGLLADAPLLDVPYVPRRFSTDSNSRFSMTIGAGSDAIVFFSESQGADRVPWALRLDGKEYVIPSDAPARALDLVRAYLPADEP